MIWGGAKLLEDPLDVVQKFKAWLIVGFNCLLQFNDWKAGWFMNILDLLEAENLSYLWYILLPGDQRGGKVMMEDNTLIQRIFFCFPSLWIEDFPNQKWVTHRTSALVCCTMYLLVCTSIYLYSPQKFKKGVKSWCFQIELILTFSSWILEFKRNRLTLLSSSWLFYELYD